jgi:hypothetical protein
MPHLPTLALLLACLASPTARPAKPTLHVADGFAVVRPKFHDDRAVPPSFFNGFLCPLRDRRLLIAYPHTGNLEVAFSSDGGSTWTAPRVIPRPAENVTFGKPAVLRTRGGNLWLFTYGFVRWSLDPGKAKSDLWATRSTDGGKTWEKPRLVWKGYTGMTQGAIETRDGHLVVPLSYPGPRQPGTTTARFLAGCVLSTDGGKSWDFAGGIEVPADADARMRKRVNGGAIEPCVVERKDGRLWMLLRTVTGHLWECHSRDGGRTWNKPTPTRITCGGPAYLARLASGQLVLVWNEADPSQAEKWSGWPNGYATASIALSIDEGKTWGEPVRFASDGKRVVHPLAVQYGPGKLLLTLPGHGMLLRTTTKRLSPPPGSSEGD